MDIHKRMPANGYPHADMDGARHPQSNLAQSCSLVQEAALEGPALARKRQSPEAMRG